MLDLILRGGRVIDPLNSIDGVMDVGFAAGKVWGIAARIDDQAKEIRDVTGTIVTPGLIDLHTHVYWGGTSISVDATDLARRSGTTTLVDAGSAGPGNFAGLPAACHRAVAGCGPPRTSHLLPGHLCL